MTLTHNVNGALRVPLGAPARRAEPPPASPARSGRDRLPGGPRRGPPGGLHAADAGRAGGGRPGAVPLRRSGGPARRGRATPRTPTARPATSPGCATAAGNVWGLMPHPEDHVVGRAGPLRAARPQRPPAVPRRWWPCSSALTSPPPRAARCGARCATPTGSTTTACCWSPPTGSPPSTGCWTACPTRARCSTSCRPGGSTELADVVAHHLLAVPDPNVAVAQALPAAAGRGGRARLHHRRHLHVAVAAVRRGRPASSTGDGCRTGLRKNEPLPRRDGHAHHQGAGRRPRRAGLPGRGGRPGPGRRGAAGTQVMAVAVELFRRGQARAATAGLILVDTKYEFGLDAARRAHASSTRCTPPTRPATGRRRPTRRASPQARNPSRATRSWCGAGTSTPASTATANRRRCPTRSSRRCPAATWPCTSGSPAGLRPRRRAGGDPHRGGPAALARRQVSRRGGRGTAVGG